MARGNPQNLVQNKHQTPSERQRNAQKAGIASGKSRRDKKFIQDALQKALNGKYDIGDPEKGNVKTLGGYDAIALSLIQEAIKGDVKAFVAIRDSIGEKPKDTLELENESLTGISIKFVNKSNPNKKLNSDPKIVGDYTPPSNADEE